MENKILSPKEWVDSKEYPHMKDMMQQYADYVARERAVGFADWGMTNDIPEGATPEQLYDQYMIDNAKTHSANGREFVIVEVVRHKHK